MEKIKIIRLAAIDIGSNAIRLLITDVINYKKKIVYKKSSLTRVPLRLGEDSFFYGHISDEKKEKLALTMQAFSSLMKITDVEAWKVCATSAMREADNGKDVVDYVFKESGIQIEIISGKEEANHVFTNRIDEEFDDDTAYLFTDVGGGSTEVTLLYKGKEISSDSFNLGTVRLLKSNFPEEWDRMYKWLDKNCLKYRNVQLIGSGGNINKIKSLFGNKLKIHKEDLQKFYGKLKKMSYEERIVKLGLNLDRADVIIPAMKIFLAIMDHSKANKIIVPTIGVADGLIKELYCSLSEKVIK